MNRTTMLAAAAVAILGGVLYFLHLEHFERKVTGGQTLGVLVLLREIPAGRPVTRDALGIRQVPGHFVEDRHVRAAQLAQVLGVLTQREVGNGNWLTWDDVGTDLRDNSGLSDQVAEGMRAFTVIMDSEHFGQMVASGDHVDVLFTAEVPEDPDHPRSMVERRSIPRLTSVLLQNVLVMAVGQRQASLDEGEAAAVEGDTGAEMDMRNRRARDAKFVTLGVSLQEAVYLQHAIMYAKNISIVVRNPDDGSIVTEIPITTDLDLIEAEQRARVQRHRPTTPRIRRLE